MIVELVAGDSVTLPGRVSAFASSMGLTASPFMHPVHTRETSWQLSRANGREVVYLHYHPLLGRLYATARTRGREPWVSEVVNALQRTFA